jgi:hypothetical protein
VKVTGRAGGQVQVESARGRARTLPLEQASRFELYRTAELAVARGEALRVTRNGTTTDKKHRLNNGDLVRVAGFSPTGDIELENGWRISKDYGHLAPGAVITSHASQGKSVDIVFVAQSVTSLPASSAEQFYVSSSRGEKALRLYTDDKAALRAAIARHAHARSASEVWQAHQEDRARRWHSVRRLQQRSRARMAAWPDQRRDPQAPVPGSHQGASL